MIAYCSILLTAFLALAGLQVYWLLLGASVLFAISVVEQRKLSGRFAAIGASYMLTMSAWQSAGEAFLASSAAYGLGAVVRYLVIN